MLLPNAMCDNETFMPLGPPLRLLQPQIDAEIASKKAIDEFDALLDAWFKPIVQSKVKAIKRAAFKKSLSKPMRKSCGCAVTYDCSCDDDDEAEDTSFHLPAPPKTGTASANTPEWGGKDESGRERVWVWCKCSGAGPDPKRPGMFPYKGTIMEQTMGGCTIYFTMGVTSHNIPWRDVVCEDPMQEFEKKEADNDN